MTTRSAFSASRRIVLRTLGASRRTRLAPARDVLLHERGERRSACARTARVIPGGTRWRTKIVASWWRAMRVGVAQGKFGVRTAADRDEDPPDLLASRAA